MILRKRGFTLVELLVVITIIAMLVGLLMPAVQSAREAGRRAQCMNNQHQISIALHQYDSEKGYLPGYVGEYRGGSGANMYQRKISWWVSILPQLGRMDVSDRWKDAVNFPVVNYPSTNPGDSAYPPPVNQIPAMYMKIANCPSYSPPSANDSWLSYRVNVGRMLQNSFAGGKSPTANPTTQFVPAEGVFTDQFSDNAPSAADTTVSQEQIVHVNLGFIDSKDGTSCTLMVSENAASVPPTPYYFEGKWSPLIGNLKTDTQPSPDGDPAILTGITTSPYYQQLAVTNALRLGFNWAGMDPNNPNGTNPVPAIPPPTPASKMFSNHPGGVVASFCDGHQTFLKTDLEPVIFMQLMCPFDRGVYISGTVPSVVTGISDPTTKTLPVAPLDENKF